MLNFNTQLNGAGEVKTLNEMVEEIFAVKKPVIDVSFFYSEKTETIKNEKLKEIRPWQLRNKKKL